GGAASAQRWRGRDRRPRGSGGTLRLPDRWAGARSGLGAGRSGPLPGASFRGYGALRGWDTAHARVRAALSRAGGDGAALPAAAGAHGAATLRERLLRRRLERGRALPYG